MCVQIGAISAARHFPAGPTARLPFSQKRYCFTMRLDLTKRSDYAIRAMLALTMVGDGLLSSRKIAEEMKIPPRFLPQIMGDLTRAGLVLAHPGRAGGYQLTEGSASVTLLRVIEAVEGDPHRQVCVMRGTACGVDGECGVHDVFYAAEHAILKELSSSTLQQIIDKYRAKMAVAAAATAS
jgi:Rrf2 family protein